MTDIGHVVARSPITVRAPMEPKGNPFLWGVAQLKRLPY